MHRWLERGHFNQVPSALPQRPADTFLPENKALEDLKASGVEWIGSDAPGSRRFY